MDWSEVLWQYCFMVVTWFTSWIRLKYDCDPWTQVNKSSECRGVTSFPEKKQSITWWISLQNAIPTLLLKTFQPRSCSLSHATASFEALQTNGNCIVIFMSSYIRLFYNSARILIQFRLKAARHALFSAVHCVTKQIPSLTRRFKIEHL